MLKLPKGWQGSSGGKLAEVLLEQLPELRLQTEFLRNLITVSLDPARDHPAESAGARLRALLERFNQMVVDNRSDERLFIEIPSPPVYRTERVRVPTYDPDGTTEYDYNRPENVTLQEGNGFRVVMGNPTDADSPDVLIERGVDLWRVFVHPNNGDPLCIIEIRSNLATIETDAGELMLEQRLK